MFNSCDKVDSVLYVWDSIQKAPLEFDNIIYWNGSPSDSDNIISINKLVESDADLLKDKYLELVYNLGESKYNLKKITEVLKINSKLSFWWLTLIAEKCNYSNASEINNVIKVMSFEKFILSQQYKEVHLISENDNLAEALSIFLRKTGVGFHFEKCKNPAKKSLKGAYDLLPSSVKGLIWLVRHLVGCYPLKGVGVESWKNSAAENMFVSYLFNIDMYKMRKGIYESHYWNKLPQILQKKGIKTNWLHLYEKSNLIPTARKAKKVILKFNESKDNSQVHTTIHAFISIKIIFKVLVGLYKLRKSLPIVLSVIKKESSFYWPLLKRDIELSLTGPSAASNLLFFYLNEKALSCIKKQKKGYYLQENQGWEFGFISAWKSNNSNSVLVGYPHSTIRYWDLRYFFDKKSYKEQGSFDLPLPDYVGMNGREAKRMYIDGGYPLEMLVDIEALRYMHLLNPCEELEKSSDNTILVLGDYLREDTNSTMLLLKDSLQYVDKKYSFIVKSHPACQINVEDYPEIDYIVVNDQIQSLFKHCSIVICSSLTSAVVDAYCSQKYVISIIKPGALNFSPLRDNCEVLFVNTSLDLAEAINGVTDVDIQIDKCADFFYIDKDIPKWKKLIN